jgi:hypothetical protein
MILDKIRLRNVMRHLFRGLGSLNLRLFGGSRRTRRGLRPLAGPDELLKFVRRADTDAAVKAAAFIVLLLLLAVLRR